MVDGEFVVLALLIGFFIGLLFGIGIGHGLEKEVINNLIEDGCAIHHPKSGDIVCKIGEKDEIAYKALKEQWRGWNDSY